MPLSYDTSFFYQPIFKRAMLRNKFHKIDPAVCFNKIFFADIIVLVILSLAIPVYSQTRGLIRHLYNFVA